jgi:penicillin amidase
MFSILVLTLLVSGSAQAQDPVTTTRDARGVWFIEGGTLYDVYEAMGYAEATDRLWQMDIFRRVSRGKMAEIFGPAGLEFDVPMRILGHSDDELAAQFAALSTDAQTAIQAYVDGVNRRIAEVNPLVGGPSGDFLLMPFEYWIICIQNSLMAILTGGAPATPVLPTPWEVNDVLAWVVVVTRFFDPEGDVVFGDNAQIHNLVLFQTLQFVYGAQGQAMFGDLRWVNDPTALTYIPGAASAKSAAVPEMVFPSLDGIDLAAISEAAENMRARNERLARLIEDVGANVQMGSYAWAVSGDRTASGNPTLYSGPQMGFDAPAYVVEGSIRGGGFEISGMSIPNIPGIIIGRTPHHAWSMQVGHAHTADFWLEPPEAVALHRVETINVLDGDPVMLPVFRSAHGPIVEPMPYNPLEPPSAIFAFQYSHWGREVGSMDAYLGLARAQSMDEFDAAIANVGVSQHYTYVDRDGNIAYWMSGWDPVRGPGYNPLIPSFTGLNPDWTGERRPRAHDRNTAQGYYGGWNNKASVDYFNATNAYGFYFGPAHRAHVIDEYLSAHDDLSFEEVRELALNIATTDSFGGGGNTWSFVDDAFKAAVAANPDDDRNAAIAMLDAWDGHFVAGGPSEWRFGAFKADAWVLQDAWIREVLRITFEDEFRVAGMSWVDQSKTILFSVLLRGLAGQTFYDWFQDAAGTGNKPIGAEAIIIRALDNVIEHLGLGPYNEERGTIEYRHGIFGQKDILGLIYDGTPAANRSTYAHVVEFDMNGPNRIESMFPLGQSGAMLYNGTLSPTFDPNFFSMVPVFDAFLPRPFPLFE